jgi:hypothetical protein
MLFLYESEFIGLISIMPSLLSHFNSLSTYAGQMSCISGQMAVLTGLKKSPISALKV